MFLRLFIVLAAGLASSSAEVVDSLVASVGLTAIKHSDVLREIRMTALLNRQEPDFGPAAQKEAVNQLIDQALIRQEIEAGFYVPEDRESANVLMKQLRASYGGDAALKTALESRGFMEEELKKELEWQASVLRFVQLRFGAGGGAPPEDVDEAFFTWLNQMREDKRVQIQEARLQ